MLETAWLKVGRMGEEGGTGREEESEGDSDNGEQRRDCAVLGQDNAS